MRELRSRVGRLRCHLRWHLHGPRTRPHKLQRCLLRDQEHPRVHHRRRRAHADRELPGDDTNDHRHVGAAEQHVDGGDGADPDAVVLSGGGGEGCESGDGEGAGKKRKGKKERMREKLAAGNELNGTQSGTDGQSNDVPAEANDDGDERPKKKRKRKHKASVAVE